MIRSHVIPAAAIHAIDCDCAACRPRPNAIEEVGKVGVAGMAVGAGVALLLALACQPAATVASLLAVIGVGL